MRLRGVRRISRHFSTSVHPDVEAQVGGDAGGELDRSGLTGDGKGRELLTEELGALSLRGAKGGGKGAACCARAQQVWSAVPVSHW